MTFRPFEIALPAVYRTQDCLRFLGRDAEAVSERVHATGFEKAFLHLGKAAVVRLRFANGIATCETDCESEFAARTVASRLLGLPSDLVSNSVLFEQKFSADPLLGRLISQQQGLYIPLSATPWEGVAWAILGQQITLRFAIALRREMILAYGVRHSGGLTAHPDPLAVSEVELSAFRSLKFSKAKADYLTGAARALLANAIPLTNSETAEETGLRLRSIRGFGPWTVQYVMLRALGYPDCLPASDAGLAQGLHRLPEVGNRLSEARIQQLLARFAPYRSLATCHVWASL